MLQNIMQTFRSHQRGLIASGFVGLALLVLLAWFLPPKQTVSIFGHSPEPTVLATRATTVGATMQEAGIELGPYDKLEPAPETPTTDGLRIRIHRAVAVKIAVDGETKDVHTTAATVAEVLQEAQIALGDRDRIEPNLEAAVRSDLSVRVVRVRAEAAHEDAEIPADSERRQDPELNEGNTKLIQEGQPGIERTSYRLVYEDGKLVSKEKTDAEVVREPVPRITAVGTRPRAIIISRAGFSGRAVRTVSMRATGYAIGDGLTPGTHTRLGLPAERGVVAVDPQVIPLGTRLYIEGYGPAIAADTGGAIQGHKIDLCFNSVSEAHAFGSRNVVVHVLQ